MRRTPPRKPIQDRFWPKVKKTRSCWLWTAVTDWKGYGRISRGGREGHIYAHRVSWQIHFGAIPDGQLVLHHCDNPLCVRPDHLFLGTKADNTRDMVSKGRHPSQKYPGLRRGERNGCAKLTNKQAEEIRRIYAGGGISQASLGTIYGVDQTRISRIVLCKNYVHTPL